MNGIGTTRKEEYIIRNKDESVMLSQTGKSPVISLSGTMTFLGQPHKNNGQKQVEGYKDKGGKKKQNILQSKLIIKNNKLFIRIEASPLNPNEDIFVRDLEDIADDSDNFYEHPTLDDKGGGPTMPGGGGGVDWNSTGGGSGIQRRYDPNREAEPNVTGRRDPSKAVPIPIKESDWKSIPKGYSYNPKSELMKLFYDWQQIDDGKYLELLDDMLLRFEEALKKADMDLYEAFISAIKNSGLNVRIKIESKEEIFDEYFNSKRVKCFDKKTGKYIEKKRFYDDVINKPEEMKKLRDEGLGGLRYYKGDGTHIIYFAEELFNNQLVTYHDLKDVIIHELSHILLDIKYGGYYDGCDVEEMTQEIADEISDYF